MNHLDNGKAQDGEEIPNLREKLQGVNLFLVGLMGAGKSTVGKLLAHELGYRFFDTDTLVEQIARQSIATIFAESGESAFRDLETQVLAELAGYGKLAIATGGGIVLRQHNWSYLYHGLVIWLDVPVEELYARLQGDTTRPLLQQPDPLHTLQTLLDERKTLYAQADLRVSVQPGESPQAISDRILRELPTILKPPATPFTDE